MKEKVDYLGIRKIFERENNQAGIDSLIEKYLEINDGQKNWDKFIGDPVVEGVQLSKEFISRIYWGCDALALVVAGAKPADKLIDRVLSKNTTESHKEMAIILYKRGFIDFDRLFNYVTKGDNRLYGLKKVIQDPEIFDNLTKDNIERIRDYLNNIIVSSHFEYLEMATRVLKRLPFDLENIILVENMINHFKNLTSNTKKYINFDFLYDLIKEFLRDSKDVNDILERLHERPDYLFFMMRFLFQKTLFGEDNLTAIEQTIVFKMGKGEIKRPAFAMHVFNGVNHHTNEIFNAWVANDRPLELDIYFTNGFAALPRTFDSKDITNQFKRGTFLSFFDEQDDKYIKALGERENAPEKPFSMKPVDN